MKVWKRNAIVATVLVLICAGVYLNWNAANAPTMDLTETLDAEQVMNQTEIILPEELSVPVEPGDQFAQIRLSRQESRDSAVELLQETMAYEEGTEAADTLDSLVGDALAEAQIESLVIAKGYGDCVAYLNDNGISVAVSSPDAGLTESDVALISDIVTTQSGVALSDVRIIEVK